MKVNKDEDIIMTLQLIKSDGTSVETDATVSYKIFDNSGVVEVVSSQTAAYNSTTKSYLDSLDVSADWTTQDVGSYIIVWTVADTDDDFATTYTENLEVGIDKDKVDRILALVHENIYIDNTEFDRDGNMYSARLRIYSNSASVGTTSDVLATYTITAETTGIGKFSYWKQVKV
jgi:hypothetical protein